MNSDGFFLTHYVDKADLGDHGICVDLAHVVALVLFLDVADVKVPGVVLVVSDLEAGNPGDHVTVNRHDHLAVQVDERHLGAKKRKVAREKNKHVVM